MRRIIHQLHDFSRFIDDGCAIAPGKNGCKKTSYFNVLFFTECVWYGYGITVNKKRPIVGFNLFVEEGLEVEKGLFQRLKRFNAFKWFQTCLPAGGGLMRLNGFRTSGR
jgi:hypothetical protein